MSREAQLNTEHGEVQQLLPWFVSEKLRPDQVVRVEQHLRECAACRRELEWERSMQAATPPASPELDAEAALARLMPRLEERPHAPPAAGAAIAERLRTWLFGSGWMPWALAGQAVLIAGLAFQLMPGGPEQYRALGNAGQTPAGNIVVVFDPALRLDRMQHIMQASGARIVGGPTVTGAFMLTVPPPRQAEALAELKSQAGVQLAESLNSQGPP